MKIRRRDLADFFREQENRYLEASNHAIETLNKDEQRIEYAKYLAVNKLKNDFYEQLDPDY